MYEIQNFQLMSPFYKEISQSIVLYTECGTFFVSGELIYSSFK